MLPIVLQTLLHWPGEIPKYLSFAGAPKAQTWYVGANVKGKPQGLTLFTGGFPKYREYCAAAVANEFADLAFDRARAGVGA